MTKVLLEVRYQTLLENLFSFIQNLYENHFSIVSSLYLEKDMKFLFNGINFRIDMKMLIRPCGGFDYHFLIIG